MLSPLSVLSLGFLLGLRHATDADHVVAVTTIVARQKKLQHAAMVGVTWGIGHSLTILIVGVAIILFHVVIPPKLELAFEFSVAIALVVLGILNLTGATKRIQDALSHTHAHVHDHGSAHVHIHSHTDTVATRRQAHTQVHDFIQLYGVFHLLRPFVIGIIHGLAGSAAVALLILGSIADQTVAIAYLGIFGIGTIIGMMMITTLLGVPIIAGSRSFARADRIITAVAGLVSIVYGVYFGYEIGIVEGLFTK